MISVIWSDRHNMLWVCVGFIMFNITLQSYILFQITKFRRIVLSYSMPCIIMFFCGFFVLAKSGLALSLFVVWIPFCMVSHMSSINLMSAFLSAMLLPCQAAAWRSEVFFLSVVKDSCMSQAAAYISYSHWCVIPFILETHFRLLVNFISVGSFYFWICRVYLTHISPERIIENVCN